MLSDSQCLNEFKYRKLTFVWINALQYSWIKRVCFIHKHTIWIIYKLPMCFIHNYYKNILSSFIMASLYLLINQMAYQSQWFGNIQEYWCDYIKTEPGHRHQQCLVTFLRTMVVPPGYLKSTLSSDGQGVVFKQEIKFSYCKTIITPYPLQILDFFCSNNFKLNQFYGNDILWKSQGIEKRNKGKLSMQVIDITWKKVE